MPPSEIAQRECHKFNNYLRRATQLRIMNHPMNTFSSIDRKQSIDPTENPVCRQQAVNRHAKRAIGERLRRSSSRDSKMNADRHSNDCQTVACAEFVNTVSESSDASYASDNDVSSIMSSMSKLDFDACIPIYHMGNEPLLSQHTSALGSALHCESSKWCEFSNWQDGISECNNHMSDRVEDLKDEIPSEILHLFEEYVCSPAGKSTSTVANPMLRAADTFFDIDTFPDCVDLNDICSSLSPTFLK